MSPEDEGNVAARPPEGDRAEPWLLAACLCLLAAVACLWLALFDAAFVLAALGAVSWFLNVRSKLPRREEKEDEEDEEADEPFDDEG